MGPRTVRAACGVLLLTWLTLTAVGTGGSAEASSPSALTCSEAGLDAAGSAGGDYTFACTNTTIKIEAPVVVSAASLTIDGTGQGVTITPDTSTCHYPTCGIRLFTVQAAATFDLSGVTLDGGLSLGTSGVNGTDGGQGEAGTDGTNATTGGDGTAGMGGAMWVASGATVSLGDMVFAGDNAIGGNGGNGGNGGDGTGGTTGTAGTSTGTGGGCTSGNAGGPGTSGGDAGVGGNAGSGSLAQGGAIFSAGNLTVTSSSFTNNHATGGGGGEAGAGGSGGGGGEGGMGGAAVCAGNTSGNGGGGGDGGTGADGGSGGAAASSQGGAIYNTGTLTVSGSTFASNRAGGGFGAGPGGSAGSAGDPGVGGGPGDASAGATPGNTGADGSYGSGGTTGTAGKGGDSQGGAVYSTGPALQLSSDTFEQNQTFGNNGGPGGTGAGAEDGDDGGTGGDGGAGEGGAVFAGGALTVGQTTFAHDNANAGAPGAGGDGGFGNGFPGAGTGGSGGSGGTAGMAYGGGVFVDNGVTANLSGVSFVSEGAQGGPGADGGGGGAGDTVVANTDGTGGDGADGGSGGSAFGGALFSAGTTTVTGGTCESNAAGGGPGGFGGLGGNGFDSLGNQVSTGADGTTGMVGLGTDNDFDGTASACAPIGGRFFPLSPTRILDTRSAKGAPGPVPAGGTAHLTVDGVGGVPASNVAAVVVNVTVTQPNAAGYLTVYPDGGTKPTVSNLNFGAGETVPNLVIAPVGSDGKVAIYNGSGGTVQVLADVSGYFTAGAAGPGSLSALPPTRILDTRSAKGAPGPVPAGGTAHLTVDGVGGVPASNVAAVVVNVTVTQPNAAGYLTVYPDGGTKPTVSNLNFGAGETVPNLVIAPVGSDGKVAIYNGSGGTVQVLADVSGYFPSG